jgi:hypothetical protein
MPVMDVIEAPFRSAVDRRSASDRAHIGDIVGAMGTVASHDVGPRRSLRRRLVTLAAVMGPGLIVMAGDNDAGSLSVYAQAGQSHGLRLVWILVLLAPALIVNQEMAVRLGAVTGAGHARLIVERFGRTWGAFALSDLLIVNLLMILTEFIGVTLALGYFGVSRYVAVPIAAAALVAVTSTGSFRRWERAMYVLIAANVLMVPLVLLSRSHVGAGAGAGLVPRVAGAYVARGRRTAPAALDVPAGGRRPADPDRMPAVRERWTMPRLELLERPVWSRTRTIGMYTLRGYLLVAVLMLVVKAVEIGLGH